jgi:predicted transcriptional regulator
MKTRLIDGVEVHSSSGNVLKIIKVGIASQEKIRERVLVIAKGELKPKPSDPRIWFTSMRSLSQVLSDENHARLGLSLYPHVMAATAN